MRPYPRNFHSRFVPRPLRSFCILAILTSVCAGSPKIDLIELFLTDRVLIHFDTDPNRTYELQVSETPGATGSAEGTWTNLYVTPNIPSPNHYIIVDTRTNRQRFYRLRVTP